MRGVSQKISSYIRGAAELCLLSQDIIYKPAPMDVASFLGVNHVNSVCCAIVSYDCAYLVTICYLLHELCYQLVNVCMFSFSLQHIEG